MWSVAHKTSVNRNHVIEYKLCWVSTTTGPNSAFLFLLCTQCCVFLCPCCWSVVNFNLVEGWRLEPRLKSCWCFNKTRSTMIKSSGLNARIWTESWIRDLETELNTWMGGHPLIEELVVRAQSSLTWGIEFIIVSYLASTVCMYKCICTDRDRDWWRIINMAQGLMRIYRISLSPPHGSGAFDCVCHGDEPSTRARDELFRKRNIGSRGHSSDKLIRPQSIFPFVSFAHLWR